MGERKQTIEYDELASVYSEHRAHSPAVLDGLVAGAELVRSSQVLEVGCGTANLLTALRPATGSSCWGIDPSKGVIGAAEGREVVG
jgi:ubiquinone/menaquinone biosynthesis C-methylase UbiE